MMDTEDLRKRISETFGDKFILRLAYMTLWWLHSWINAFSEPLKKVLPMQVWFIGTDRNPFRLKFRKRPLGYWVAHVVGPIVLLFILSALGKVSTYLLGG